MLFLNQTKAKFAEIHIVNCAHTLYKDLLGLRTSIKQLIKLQASSFFKDCIHRDVEFFLNNITLTMIVNCFFRKSYYLSATNETCSLDLFRTGLDSVLAGRILSNVTYRDL